MNFPRLAPPRSRSALSHFVAAALTLLVPLFVLSGLSFVVLTGVTERFAGHAEEARQESKKVVTALTELESAERAGESALEDPTPLALRRFNSAGRRVNRVLGDLERLDDEAERRLARHAHDEWNRLREFVLGSDPRAGDTDIGRLYEGLDAINSDVLSIGREADAELRVEIAATRRANERDSLLLLCQVLLGALLMTLVVRWLLKRIVTPLKDLRQAADHLGRGDLSHRVRLTRPPSELNAVATTFNEMAGSLEQSRTRLRHAATRDALTGLANRSLLEQRATAALTEPASRPRPSLLFMDLDGFKGINDSLGHAQGDQVLTAVARRLEGSVREADVLARVGGDEFAVLVSEPTSSPPHQASAEVAERILRAFDDPFPLADATVVLTASVGIAVAEADDDFGSLLRNADIAMYSAKELGPGRYDVFNSALHEAAVRRLEMIAGLREALHQGHLRLVYQPLVDMRTEAVVAAEALVRWDHPVLGTLSPAEFIPLAEETGLIVPLGRWVLDEACRRARHWDLRHPGRPPLRVNVNLSAQRILDPCLVQDTEKTLKREQLDPSRLTFEITETALMQDIDACVRRLHELRDLGVQVALDDFGTGYSSLSYLRNLPVTQLKIARPFVAGLDETAADRALVRAIVELAHGLGMGVVGEGVEERSQHRRLRGMGCDLGQGFLYARPMDPEALDRLLDNAPAPGAASALDGMRASSARPLDAETHTHHLRVLANLPDVAILTLDRELRYTRVEGEAVEAAGWRPEWLLGRRPRDVLRPERAAAIEEVYRIALSGSRHSFSWDSGRGGRRFSCEVEPVRDAQGRVSGVLVVARGMPVGSAVT